MTDARPPLAVITGGGGDIGRALALELASEGWSVALGDISDARLAASAAEVAGVILTGAAVSTHALDVSDANAAAAFAANVVEVHDRGSVELLVNGAGVGGGASFVAGDPRDWERTFQICWGSVYACCRAFLPMLRAAVESCIVNISSVNGLWASLGPRHPNTAYSAAKFAVRGFTESLIEDCRVHAPNVRVVLAMPGHVGTSFMANSTDVLTEGRGLSVADLDGIRDTLASRGIRVRGLPDDTVRALATRVEDTFRASAPTSAADVASAIVAAVRDRRWRVVIGEDALAVDEAVRADPESAYDGLHIESIAQALRGRGRAPVGRHRDGARG